MHRFLLLLLLIVESLPLDSAVAAIPPALDGPELKSSANEYLPRQSTGDDNAGEIPADDGSAIGTVSARLGAAEIPAISPDNPEFESRAPISIDYAALDAGLCARAALSAERIYRIPDQFLVAMGRVESGRRISSGRVVAWPWTVNAQGRGYIYQSEQQAIEAVRAFRAQGVTSIDVGCMQVNLQQHPNAFPSLEAAFDPAANANYAARFLTDLFGRTGSWPGAAAAYHSFTPDIGNAYQWKVLESWAAPLGGAGRIATPGSPRVAMTARHASPLPTGDAAFPSSLTASAARSTRPFSPAIHGFAPPPSRPSMASGSGRTLAFYRANAIHVARQPSLFPARF